MIDSNRSYHKQRQNMEVIGTTMHESNHAPHRINAMCLCAVVDRTHQSAWYFEAEMGHSMLVQQLMMRKRRKMQPGIWNPVIFNRWLNSMKSMQNPLTQKQLLPTSLAEFENINSCIHTLQHFSNYISSSTLHNSAVSCELRSWGWQKTGGFQKWRWTP